MPPQAERERTGDSTKLYLHIGMPKTGTTSFQNLLGRNGLALGKIGYVYPDKWIAGHPGGHHQLTEKLARGHDQALATSRQVCAYLGKQRGRTVILSAEGLASMLLEPRTQRGLAHFAGRCSAVAETTVVMALRRLDEFLASAYLQVTKKGRLDGALTMEHYLEGRARKWTNGFFKGIRWFRDHAKADLVMIPYHEGEDTLPSLLRAVGIEDASVLQAADPQRVNRRLGLKAQVVFMFPDEALAVLGVKRRRQLIDLFSSGGFEFRDEIYEYDVLGGEVRSQIQARALEEARRWGVDEYADAFPEIESRSLPPAPFDTSLLSTGDLSDLAEAIGGQGNGSAPAAAPAAERR